MSLDLTDDKSTLVQVMAWCHQATSHYLSQCWPRPVSPYGVIRPQWVKANFMSYHNKIGHAVPYQQNLWKYNPVDWLWYFFCDARLIVSKLIQLPDFINFAFFKTIYIQLNWNANFVKINLPNSLLFAQAIWLWNMWSPVMLRTIPYNTIVTAMM